MWKCRKQNDDINACFRLHASAGVLEDIKRQWIRAGRPADLDWMPTLPYPGVT